MRAKDAVGRYGEDVAARYLAAAGLLILDRNWRCRDGEIDIVAREGSSLVVCEVKTRSGTAFGTPFDALTAPKVARLRRLAAAWLATHDVAVPDVRFDVVGVLTNRRGAASVEHRRGVI